MDFLPCFHELIFAAAREKIQSGQAPVSLLRRVEAIEMLSRGEAVLEAVDSRFIDELLSAAVIETGRCGFTLSVTLGVSSAFKTDIRILTRAAVWLIYDRAVNSGERYMHADFYVENGYAVLKLSGSCAVNKKNGRQGLIVRALRHGAKLCGGALLCGGNVTVFAVRAEKTDEESTGYTTMAEFLDNPFSVVRAGLAGL